MNTLASSLRTALASYPALRSLCLVLVGLVAASSLTGCSSTPKLNSQKMNAGAGVLPPPLPGEDTVWINFDDFSGQIGDEYDALATAVEARGYTVTSYDNQAVYRLWVTVRNFEEVESEKEASAKAMAAGAIMGGAGGAAASIALGGNTAQTIGVAAIGAGVGAGISSLLNQDKVFMAIFDVQLAKGGLGGTQIGAQTDTRDQLENESVALDAAPGIQGQMEGGGTTIDRQQESTVSYTDDKARVDDRILITYKATKLTADEAKGPIVERALEILPNYLPRIRR